MLQCVTASIIIYLQLSNASFFQGHSSSFGLHTWVDMKFWAVLLLKPISIHPFIFMGD